MKKPVFSVSDQVRHKPGCTATKDGWRLEISDSEHYENMSVQYTAIFHGCKNDNFQMKNFDIFLIFAQNIDCGNTLEPPQRGGSNEYPQSMFWSKNKKKYVYPSKPHFFYIKVG